MKEEITLATVTFTAVTRVYPESSVPAVINLDLHIADGELMVLVGPPGCGSSTVLRMLAGLEPVDSGEIAIGERTVTTVPADDRNIAMVFQNYALYPHLTVAENMGVALKIAGVGKDERERRIRDAASLLALEPYLDQHPKALSGSQRQRVAIGRAIVREPAVFLMDDPLSNLDASLRTHTLTQIAALQRRFGVTTIFATHAPAEALAVADRIAVLHDGVLQQLATPAEILESPANETVADLFREHVDP